MIKAKSSEPSLSSLLKQIKALTESLRDFKKDAATERLGESATKEFVTKSGLLVDELRHWEARR